VGSSTQIAMFVVPLCVVIAWGYDVPLSLDFHPFETGTLLLTVVLVAFLIQNGAPASLSPQPQSPAAMGSLVGSRSAVGRQSAHVQP